MENKTTWNVLPQCVPVPCSLAFHRTLKPTSQLKTNNATGAHCRARRKNAALKATGSTADVCYQLILPAARDQARIAFSARACAQVQVKRLRREVLKDGRLVTTGFADANNLETPGWRQPAAHGEECRAALWPLLQQRWDALEP